MKESVEYLLNMASVVEIREHLSSCDTDFIPPLRTRVEIKDYAKKLKTNAITFEAWFDGTLVGLVAVYCNNSENHIAYITSISVLRNWTGKDIATCLMKNCIEHVKSLDMMQINLEVASNNTTAISLYEKFDFILENKNKNEPFVKMYLSLKNGDNMSNKRDYNIEIKDTNNHQYAYNFDLDVMHPYMIKSFKPFFNDGSLLELGSFKGDFTKRFLKYFDDITCVEASDIAIEEARKTLGDKVTLVNSLFEEVSLPKRYDSIILTHVLEHLDDPVRVLKRINDEWLTERGRFFLVCPNANAPSRQIAVKMGLITHNTAVTSAELEHGHRCTYTLDTLERDAVSAGLNVVFRSGIFFKALANFQWDLLLQTDIISKKYLDGCYQLGQLYPDLCSSIFLLCEKGE